MWLLTPETCLYVSPSLLLCLTHRRYKPKCLLVDSGKMSIFGFRSTCFYLCMVMKQRLSSTAPWKDVFFLIWQPFQICIHQWLLLPTSDLMLPITVHVFKPQNRLYWQIQSTQATSTYKYHILKTFFVYSTRLKTTACGFTKDKCWRLQEITAQEETCA